jgi:P-type conjugative transfer protein TrbJ
MKNNSILAAKKLMLSVVVATAMFVPTISRAGVPVIDGTNLTQNVMTAVEEVAQTLKQVQEYGTQLEQYSTQLQQYENMLQNTASPAVNIWDRATATMGRLRGTIDTVTGYKNRFGNLDNYLAKFKDINTYRGSACFNGEACTEADLADLRDSVHLGSEAQQTANKAAIEGLDSQQTALEGDAATLESLQAAAQGADGQVKAIGYTNQLASQQANQLLQIRGLLIAQQNADITRNQALANKEAQQQAASDKAHVVPYAYGDNAGWSIR